MTVTDVDSSSWDEQVLGSKLPVIVDYWAPWCSWCRKLAPDFESLSGDYTGRLIFVKVNVDESPDLAARYGVQGLPTLKFLCAGRPIAEIVGYLPRNSLKVQLDGMLSMHKDCLDQSTPMKEHA